MNSRLNRRVAAGLGVAAVVSMGALTACGGSGSNGPSSTTTTTTTTTTAPSSTPAPSPTNQSLSPNGGGNMFTPAPVAPPSIQMPSPGHHNGN